eukprot:2870720-Rhodomonas_salina.1
MHTTTRGSISRTGVSTAKRPAEVQRQAARMDRLRNRRLPGRHPSRTLCTLTSTRTTTRPMSHPQTRSYRCSC